MLDSGAYDHLKDKPVVTYCTGGVRCEVLSSLMTKRGFSEVYQLEGGIVRYGETFGNAGLWEGSLYVFDDRRTMDFGTGAIFRRQRARYVNASDEEWFSVTLIANGNHFASWVNGLQVTDFVDERKPDPNPRQGRRDEAGHLSFQGHDAGTDASFRGVRAAALP